MDIPPADVAVGKIPVPPEGYDSRRCGRALAAQDYQLCADAVKGDMSAQRKGNCS
jgi:hypothetical protein